MSNQDTSTDVVTKLDANLVEATTDHAQLLLNAIESAKSSDGVVDMASIVQAIAQTTQDINTATEQKIKVERDRLALEREQLESDIKELREVLEPEFTKVFLAENVENQVLELAKRSTTITGFCYIAEIVRDVDDDGKEVVTLSKPHATLHKFVRRGARKSNTGNTTGQGSSQAIKVEVNGVIKEFPSLQACKREILGEQSGATSRVHITRAINKMAGYKVIE